MVKKKSVQNSRNNSARETIECCRSLACMSHDSNHVADTLAD